MLLILRYSLPQAGLSLGIYIHASTSGYHLPMIRTGSPNHGQLLNLALVVYSCHFTLLRLYVIACALSYS